MRVRDDLGVGEAAHLAADRFVGLVESGVADAGCPVARPDEFHERGAGFRAVAFAREPAGGARAERGRRRIGEPELVRTDDLALAHGNAAGHLLQVLRRADLNDESLDLAEAAGLLHPRRVVGDLANAGRVSGEPGETVHGALLPLERGARDAARALDELCDRRASLGDDFFCGLCSGGRASGDVGNDGVAELVRCGLGFHVALPGCCLRRQFFVGANT